MITHSYEPFMMIQLQTWHMNQVKQDASDDIKLIMCNESRIDCAITFVFLLILR